MFRAITIIETLFAMSIMAIALYFFSPSLFYLQDHIVLNNEIDQIKSFIYQIQAKARYQKHNYSISISQNLADKKWCMVAIEKVSDKQIACNCLNIASCDIQKSYYLYQTENAVVKNNSLYPKVFINVDGKSGRLESKCLRVTVNKIYEILQVEQNGVINVIQKGKRTSC
ncbi:type II secretion system protein [Glaesserella parasuis]|uniref:pilus assembly FimT family protein n=1 Tax=Glaesserella parasuis TaxID=738 RepID=UPI00243661CC|nr:type II secretion system protein [Glaesserella parasuis]MDG6338682.1 type II secretion system protein [Glaesserella parasuis]